ncbi:MAG: hypothetical protein R2825_21825 [Saprospiraceae bacterium]
MAESRPLGNIYKSLNLTWLLLLSKGSLHRNSADLSLHLVRLQRHANNKSSYTLPPNLFYPSAKRLRCRHNFDNSTNQLLAQANQLISDNKKLMQLAEPEFAAGSGVPKCQSPTPHADGR